MHKAFAADYNKPLDILHIAEETGWVDGRICDWNSSFHHEKDPCRLDSGFVNMSYNFGQKFGVADGIIRFLRMPRVSNSSPEYADEKIATELEAIRLIRERTSILVLEIHA